MISKYFYYKKIVYMKLFIKNVKNKIKYIKLNIL